MLRKIDSKIANHGLRYKQDTKTALKIIKHFLGLNKFHSRHTLGQAFTNIIQYLNKTFLVPKSMTGFYRHVLKTS